MEQTLARFVHALRSADVVVTPAETLDAMAVLDQIGVGNRPLLKDALSLTLAKSVADKHRFDACFERFFAQFAFDEAPKKTLLESFDHAELLQQTKQTLSAETHELVRMVLAQERTQLALLVQQAAERAGIAHMGALRDKTRVVEHMRHELHLGELTGLQGLLSGDLATGAAYVRGYLNEQIKRYVDVQYELVADATGRRAVMQAALAANLRHIPPAYQKDIDRAVAELAEQLRYKYKQRHKRQRRGQLDIRHMLRSNIAYDGNLFRLAWRGRKTKQGTVFVLCDVSGSVARTSRFLLLLVHGIADILPEVRSFAFSSRLGEVTAAFKMHDAARAVEEAQFEWGNGATDYGRALTDFRELVGAKLDHRSTVIVLGDARSNFYDPRTHVFKDITRRARQTLWLNPETRESWGEGDSEMRRYAPFCLHVDTLATLADLRRVAARLVDI